MNRQEDAARAVAEQQEGRRRRLDALRTKLKAREGKREYKENCEAIRGQIANLETVIATVDAEQGK